MKTVNLPENCQLGKTKQNLPFFRMPTINGNSTKNIYIPIGSMSPKITSVFILRTICPLLEYDTGTPLLSSLLFNWEGDKVHHLFI